MSISSKLDSAKKLAQMHFEVEPDLKRVFVLGPIREDDPREPIKLLEVVEGAIESGVEPIAFPSDSSHGVDFPSIIVELSTREFAELHSEAINFKGRTWTIEQELQASA